jgi:hypothetical protein
MKRSFLAASSWVLGLLLACETGLCAEATQPDPLGFQSQCPALLEQADQFAAECLAHARFLTRYFHPGGGTASIREVRGAYFRAPSVPSHFALGCTLDARGGIGNLGVYYAITPETYSKANDLPILSIEPSGDVLLSEGGTYLYLYLIREFVTDRVKPGMYYLPGYEGRIKNCEPALWPDGDVHYAWGQFKLVETQNDSDFTIFATNQGTYCNPAGPYVKLLEGSGRPIIFPGMACSWFIADDGSLLVAEPRYQRICLHNELQRDFIHEACPVSK